MPSAPDRSRFSEALPDRPNLEMQQKRAKALLRAAWAGDAGALARIRALHPKPPVRDALKLADAQLVVRVPLAAQAAGQPRHRDPQRGREPRVGASHLLDRRCHVLSISHYPC